MSQSAQMEGWAQMESWAQMEVLASGHAVHNQFVSAVVAFAIAPHNAIAPQGAIAPHNAIAPIECFLVRIHSTGATERLVDAFLSRPSRDRVRYALIAASAFEDGPGLCTITRRDQYTEVESLEVIAQIEEVARGLLAEDSTLYIYA